MEVIIMGNRRIYLALALLQALSMVGFGLTPLGPAQQPGAARVAAWQVQRLLNGMDSRWTVFRRSLDSDFRRSWQQNTSRDELTGFENAARRMRESVRERRDRSDDVRELLNQAAAIDGSIRGWPAGRTSQRYWALMRSDLDLLASYYGLEWRWTDTSYPPVVNRGVVNSLTGTYRLDPSRSDDAARAAARATYGLSAERRTRLSGLITRRLQPPEELALERRGRHIEMASSLGPTAEFDADGLTRVERTPRGRTIRVTARLTGDQLTVISSGDRGNDFRVVFDPIENGERLAVTRQIYTTDLIRPVVVNSSYIKISPAAQVSIPRRLPPVLGFGEPAPFVREGSIIDATLDDRLSTNVARDGDRFRMTVQSPSDLDGTVIEGFVSDVRRPGSLSGRAEMNLNFERIRLRGGSVYPFAGYVESVQTNNGEDVRVDSEGSISQRSSQTTRTVERTGIGAAVGALIGALAGGGKGVAIGAAIGAGAGAGSIFIQGRNNLDLSAGTRFTIRAATPQVIDEPAS